MALLLLLKCGRVFHVIVKFTHGSIIGRRIQYFQHWYTARCQVDKPATQMIERPPGQKSGACIAITQFSAFTVFGK